jgi:hypothetical protein
MIVIAANWTFVIGNVVPHVAKEVVHWKDSRLDTSGAGFLQQEYHQSSRRWLRMRPTDKEKRLKGVGID